MISIFGSRFSLSGSERLICALSVKPRVFGSNWARVGWLSDSPAIVSAAEMW